MLSTVYSRILPQGGQQTLETLEDPEKPWIFFVPGEIPWETLKLQPTPGKLCSEADFPSTDIWPCSTATFLIWGRLCLPLLTGIGSRETIKIIGLESSLRHVIGVNNVN